MYLKILSFQKTNAYKNGKPVCPEKNMSLVLFKPIIFKKKPSLIGICPGKGDKWVNITKNDLIKMNKAVLFKTNGILFGSFRSRKKIKDMIAIGPYTIRGSTFIGCFMRSRKRSPTGAPVLRAA